MKLILRKIIFIFITATAVDLSLGILLIPVENGAGIWSLLHIPVFYLFPFNYLIVCERFATFYLWPPHTGLLAVLIYIIIMAILKNHKVSKGSENV